MYIAGGVIEDDADLYGRDSLIGALLGGPDRLVALMGLRRTGKTSVLRALERRAADAGQLPLVIQLQSAGRLRDAVADGVDALLWELSGEGLDDDALDAAPIGRLLRRVERLAGQRGASLLVLVDEAELLAGARQREPEDLARFRRWLDQRSSLKRAVLSGGRTVLELAQIDGGGGDPFLAGFSQRLLSPVLSREDARALVGLTRRNGAGAAALSAGLCDELVARTGGHPYLLQVACLELREGRARDASGALRSALDSHAASWAFAEDLRRTSPSERRVIEHLLAGGMLPDGLLPWRSSLMRAGLLSTAGRLSVPLLADHLRRRGWGDGAPVVTDLQAAPGSPDPGSPDSDAAAPSTRRYVLGDCLGRGGFGVVYAGTLQGPSGFTRPVAIKLLHAHCADEPTVLARLRDEARILGLLRHPAIVHALDLTEIDGRAALVMELVPGLDLGQLLDAPVPPAVAAEITAGVASALQVAYSTQIDGAPLRAVHRDIKPSNLRVTALGEVKILDFGIARAELAAREALTRHHAPGTPGYLAPERRLGVHDDPASDIYALGVVLVQMLGGAGPGAATSPQAHAAAVDHRLGLVGPRVLRELARQMLDWDPRQRPTAGQIAERAWASGADARQLRAWAARRVREGSAAMVDVTRTEFHLGEEER